MDGNGYYSQYNKCHYYEVSGQPFCFFGVPDGLRTDNGPNLVSKEMWSYLEEMGMAHHHTTPLWPRANGVKTGHS